MPLAYGCQEASAHPYKLIFRPVGRIFYTDAAFNPKYKNNFLTCHQFLGRRAAVPTRPNRAPGQLGATCLANAPCRTVVVAQEKIQRPHQPIALRRESTHTQT